MNCPGKFVESSFNCIGTEYDYIFEPKKFLAKIEELNKQRLS